MISNVRKSKVIKKTKKDKDTTSNKMASAGKPTDSIEVTNVKQRNSSSQSKRQQKLKASVAVAKKDYVEEIQQDESATGEQFNLLLKPKDEEQLVDVSPDIGEEAKMGEDPAKIDDEDQSLEKKLLEGAEFVEIPSLKGSILEKDPVYQKAINEKGGSGNNELAEVDYPDKHTNLERDVKDDAYSKTQELINQVPNLGFSEEAAEEMVEFEDFYDDLKQPEFNKDPNQQEAQLGEDLFNDFASECGSASVGALTLKDGVNYEDDRYDEIGAYQVNYNQIDLPAGFDQDDDLDGDGKIDPNERMVKVHKLEGKIHHAMDDKVKEDYLKKFRKEVDFHHKVAYRFEKAYRLGKKMTIKKAALNQEIISIIIEHDQYIEQDPISLFYCLYFCIYYNNPDIVEFLKILVLKLPDLPQKIDDLLKTIVQNGIVRLRQIGEPLNQLVYHMVYYQAVDDELRIVYSQILRQLKFIQMRDKDAEQLLKQRDYELIRMSFEKFTTKINVTGFFKDDTQLFKSHNYRQYNQAFYEEILIDCGTEARVAQNYRERFLTKKEEILMVLEMYCKNDYVGHFLRADVSEIQHSQLVDLFMICIKNDSLKIGIQIYLRYIQSSDISQNVMELIIFSIRDSCNLHEMKLFFIHEHFDVLSIFQMNQLVDIYMEILHRPNYKMNPMLSQYNTIKYTLLIYRISWKIAQKRIYSLITKCSLLNSYLVNSLEGYLLRQQHISQLYKFMSEPIFHMTERKDSLDIMLEMNMEKLMKHPVIVEVLNLVYEGKYSVDSNALNLSQTFQCFFLMDTSDLKSINDRLIQNIISFGDNNAGKQASLQFNIWKQCIEQREKDEMLFSVLFSIIIIFFTLIIDELMAEFTFFMEEVYKYNFMKNNTIFINSTVRDLNRFCPSASDKLLLFARIQTLFVYFIIFSGIGQFTAIIQKFIILRLKDNVELSLSHLALELSVVSMAFQVFMTHYNSHENHLITDICSKVVDYSAEEKAKIGSMYSLLAQTNYFSFSMIISVIVSQYSLIMIVMLQRTQMLGELIMMVNQMINELKKFMITFGLPIGLFIIIGRQLNSEIKIEPASFFQIILDIFDGFNGKQDFSQYHIPAGKVFVSIFVIIFNVLLLSFLVAMFINRYKFVWTNLEALRRMNIIKLKNTISYDKLYGGVTITFFPISIIMLPFVIPVVVFKSERLNDFILKMQYAVMILMYCFLGVLISVPIIPLLYAKLIANAIFIQLNNKRKDYNGQHIFNMLLTIGFGPIILIISLVIDLLSLPTLLLVDERNFEFKYQASLEILSEAQVEVILTTFAKIFYMNFKEKFAGKGMSLIELMIMHRRIFSLIENLHDLCCKGAKDYREALANVQDYNMTKILTRKSSVPHRSGDIKLNMCDFNVLYRTQMDIEIYNYVDDILHLYRQGKIIDQRAASKGGLSFSEVPQGVVGFNSGVVFLPMTAQPSYLSYKRDNTDFMNNFFVNIIARSFTDIEEFLKNQEQNKESNSSIKIQAELEEIRGEWKQQLVQEATEQFASFDTKIMKANQFRGKYEINKTAKRVVGNENSYGIKIHGKDGKPTYDIQDLVDM